jgi:hypothetical protein
MPTFIMRHVPSPGAIDISTLTATQQQQLAALVVDELISQDPDNALGQGSDDMLYSSSTGVRREVMVVTGVNTFNALTFTPTAPTQSVLEINALRYPYASGVFTISGNQVTVLPAQLGYSVDALDTVIFEGR